MKRDAEVRQARSPSKPGPLSVERLRLAVWLIGFAVIAAGFSVMFGWYIHSPALIQIVPQFVPMQFNTALCFLLSGVALLASGRNQKLSVAVGGLAALIGFLTLIQYVLGVDFGIDELLMKHDITVETSQPGRMAPNTALCFLIYGLANGVFSAFPNISKRPAVKGVMNSVVVALGAVALFGYLFDMEGAYGWGSLTSMAVHTAVSFVFLGVAGGFVAWLETGFDGGAPPVWTPYVIFISGVTITICLCLAIAAELSVLDVETGEPHNPLIELLILISGLALSATLSQLFVKVRDATCRAEEAARAQEEAERANNIKSEFLASMSHEIRTPMTSVMGMADLLLDEPLTEDVRQKIYKIKDATRNLLEIINDILDISKMEAGKLELAHIDFDVPQLVDGVMGLFEEKRHDNRRKSLILEKTISAKVPQVINGDPTRLRQVLINLVGNAVKFTQEGRVEIAVDCLSGQGGTYLRFSVEDTGIGLSQGAAAIIFNDFTQANASISRHYEGSGLGLAISRRLVESMGGQIGVQSREGIGSVFWFTLPYWAATGTSDEAASSQPEAVSGRYEAHKHLSILVAEDNAINQQIIGAYLKKLGHRFVIVGGGADAVKTHREDVFDLILMDIRMPGMSGLDATKRIRKMTAEKQRVPIIALSADAVEENVRGYFDAGIDAFVAKPIDPGLLAVKINEVLKEEVHVPVTRTKGKSRQERGWETEHQINENDQDVAELLRKMEGD